MKQATNLGDVFMEIPRMERRQALCRVRSSFGPYERGQPGVTHNDPGVVPGSGQFSSGASGVTRRFGLILTFYR